jgi:hypothetical protein
MTLLEHALDAVRRGMKVFPCQPRLKIPAVAHGAKEMTSDIAQVNRWWKQNPNFNIGTNAGTIVDIDSGLENLQQALNVAKLWGFPSTLAIRTGRRSSYGIQFHFLGDGPQGGFELNGCRGEVRCLRGNQYGMFAGSIHPDTGLEYQIVVDAPIAPWPEACRLGAARAQNYGLESLATTEELENTQLVIEDALKRSQIQATFFDRAHNKDFAFRFQLICPNVGEHTDKTNPHADILVRRDGAIAFKCHHSHCSHMNWKWMRAYLESILGERLTFESNDWYQDEKGHMRSGR